MTIKDNLSDAGLPMLSGFTVLAIEGRDADAFAQAQFMNDLRPLAPGHWHWNGWLNAKGRVIALFALLRVAPDRLWLVLPDHDATSLAEALQRFVFRSKLSLTAQSEWIAAADWCADTGAAEHLDLIEGDLVSGLRLNWGSPAEPRHFWLLPAGDPALAVATPGNDARWHEYDLRHGLPRLRGDHVAAWTPHMLSLDRLAAFSVKKGCYPGQEIVARTHFLGQSKRVLTGLCGTGLTAGLGIESDGQSVGTVICANASGQRALAVLSAAEPLHAATGACHRVALLDGLRRP